MDKANRLGLKRLLVYASAILGLTTIFAFIVIQSKRYDHLVILILAAGFTYYGYRWLAFYKNLKHWHPVSATLLDIHQETIDERTRYGKIPYIYPSVRYEYSVNGKSYISDRVGYGIENYWVYLDQAWGSETKPQNVFWDNWKTGDSITVYVNPANTAMSVIVQALNKKRHSHYLAIFVSGILLLLFWLLLFMTVV